VTEIIADPSPGVATGAAGTAGTPGAIGADGADGAEVPPELVAVVSNWYSVPSVSPVTSQESGDADATTSQNFDESPTTEIRYETGAPPVAGAVTVTVAWPIPATAVGAPGVPGATSTTALVTFE
jgi:hypothetical protein